MANIFVGYHGNRPYNDQTNIGYTDWTRCDATVWYISSTRKYQCKRCAAYCFDIIGQGGDDTHSSGIPYVYFINPQGIDYTFITDWTQWPDPEDPSEPI